jgi:hypothetical protein
MRTESRIVRNDVLCAALIVLTLIAIACLVAPHFLGGQNGHPDHTRGAISGLEQVAEFYAVQHNGKYPAGAAAEAREALATVGVDAQTGGPIPPYLEEWPTDAWGTPLFYEYPTNKPTDGRPAIWSAGPDMRDGTNDDITGWVR